MATVYSGTIAARPVAGTAGDLYFATDGAALYRDDGADWVPWGPQFYSFGLPPTAGWSWVNQGTATVDSTYGGIHLYGQATGAWDVKLRVRSQPATPYVITAALVPLHMGASAAVGRVGIGFRESATGKIVAEFVSAGGKFGAGRYADPTTLSSTPVTTYGNSQPRGAEVAFMRIENNASDLKFDWSLDGVNWYRFHTEAVNNFFTTAPDQVCLWVDVFNATWGAGVTLVGWGES